MARREASARLPSALGRTLEHEGVLGKRELYVWSDDVTSRAAQIIDCARAVKTAMTQIGHEMTNWTGQA